MGENTEADDGSRETGAVIWRRRVKGGAVGWRSSEVATSMVGFGLRRERGGREGEREFNRHWHVGPMMGKNKK